MHHSSANLWENRILVEANRCSNVFIQKVPEHMRYNQRTKTVYRKRTCFDFFASVSGFSLYFDAKSLGTKSFNLTGWYKNYKQQYLSLLEANHKMNKAGLFLWYYKYEQIEFVDIRHVKNCLDRGVKSIKLGEGSYIIKDSERIDFRLLYSSIND